MVDYVFERHLSGGTHIAANKDASTAARFRHAKRALKAET
jgi:hypothetical protein